MSALLFGKLPMHGDFVARGFSADARDALDGWLAGAMAAGRRALGEAFDALYEAAPPWRFAWGGPAGWTAGAIAPSVDSVGRRFPLLLARAPVRADEVAGTAAALETAIYDAIEGGWDADTLHAAAAGAMPDPGASWPGAEGWWTLGGERFNEAFLPGARPTGLITTMLTAASPDAWGPDDA